MSRTLATALLSSVVLLSNGPGTPQSAADPARAFRDALEEGLKRHPFFSHVAWEIQERKPFLFVVQRPAEGETKYAARVSAPYPELLDPALQGFDELVARPCQLHPSPEYPWLPVVILADVGDFTAYMEQTKSYWHVQASSAYDPELRAAIVHEWPSQPKLDPRERERSARHALVHVLERVHCPKKSVPVRTWLFEGLADFLARVDVSKSDPLRPDREELKTFVADACAADIGTVLVRPLPELLWVQEPNSLEQLFRTRAGPEPDAELSSRAWFSFYRQSALFVFFLEQANEGKYRPFLSALLQSVFAGQTPVASLAAQASGATVDELELAFADWVILEHKKTWPHNALDPGLLRRVVSGPPSAAEPGEAGGNTALSMADAAPTERFALALEAVRTGAAAAGLAALENCAAGEPDPARNARLVREHGRVEEWVRTRDRFLERLAREHTPLQFDDGKRRVKAKVERLEDGFVVLEPASTGERRLAVESLEPLDLAQQMDSALEGWARFYPYVLAGDGRWKKLLKGDAPEVLALREDAAGYAELREVGAVATRLSALAAAPAPASGAEARKRLDEVGELLKKGESALLARKRGALREFSQGLLVKAFDLEKPTALLHAKAKMLGERRVELTYDFDDPREIEDFEAASYLEDWYGKEPLKGSYKNAFWIEKSGLCGNGRACLRTLYDLESPQAVRYMLEFGNPPHEGSRMDFNVGLCDDRLGRFAWGVGMFDLQVLDPDEAASATKEGGTFFPNTPYPMVLTHDGSSLALTCEGKLQQVLPYTARRDGALFLLMYSERTVRLQRLVIEGNIGPVSFLRMRELWVKRELGKLFP